MLFAYLKSVKESSRVRQVAYGVILAVLLMLVGGLCLLTVHSADDYWYSTFLDDGIGEYLPRMIDHYRTFNGRVWVHILAHILLHAGNWLFALVCCGACLAMPLWIGNAGGLSRERRWTMAALFAIGFAAMPTTFFVEGIMWISAFCNYLVPTAVLCVLICQTERGSAIPWFLLTAFLCGSATEQIGAMTCVLLVLYVTVNPQRRGIRLTACVAALTGLATVFASPATEQRAANEVPINSLEELVARMVKSFDNVTCIITGEIAVLVLLGALLILSGWLLGAHSRLPIWMGCIVGVFTLGLWFLPMELLTIGLAMVLIVLAFFALWMLLRGHRLPGSMIMTALASVCVMLPTQSVGCRNLLPFYLLLLLTTCFLALKLLPARREPVLACGALGLCAVVLLGMIPLAEGVLYNYRLDQQNLRYAGQADELGTVFYDTGYDLRYTYCKAVTGPKFQEWYLESVGLETDADFTLCCAGEPLPRILVGETRLEEAAIGCAGGIDLLPLRAVVESLGGTIIWSPEHMEVELNGTKCQLFSKGVLWMRADWKNERGMPHRMNIVRSVLYGNTYVDSSLLTEVFGLDVQWDDEGEVFIIRKG